MPRVVESRPFASGLRRGHRWALVIFAGFGSSGGRLLPAYDKIHGTGGLVLLAAGHVLLDAMWVVLLAAVAGGAWQLAAENDPALRGAGQLG